MIDTVVEHEKDFVSYGDLEDKLSDVLDRIIQLEAKDSAPYGTVCKAAALADDERPTTLMQANDSTAVPSHRPRTPPRLARRSRPSMSQSLRILSPHTSTRSPISPPPRGLRRRANPLPSAWSPPGQRRSRRGATCRSPPARTSRARIACPPATCGRCATTPCASAPYSPRMPPPLMTRTRARGRDVRGPSCEEQGHSSCTPAAICSPAQARCPQGGLHDSPITSPRRCSSISPSAEGVFV